MGGKMSQNEELNQAIALIMAGKKNDALPILRNILLIRENRNNEIAWLSLGTCLETKEDKIYCFREAQRINPNNEQAKKALEQLTPNSTATPHVDRDTLQLARMIQPKPKPKSVISNRGFQVFIGIIII